MRASGIPVCKQYFLNSNDEELVNDTVLNEDIELQMRLRDLSGGCGVECGGCTWYGPICRKDVGDCILYCSIL